MAKIAIVKKDDESIVTWYEADEPMQGSYGGPWGDLSLHEHLELPAEMDFETVSVENSEFVEDQTKVDAKETRLWALLRAERNAKLTACDWTQLVDSPLDANKKTEWATYRQNLRDLPENTIDPASPTWPTEPAA